MLSDAVFRIATVCYILCTFGKPQNGITHVSESVHQFSHSVSAAFNPIILLPKMAQISSLMLSHKFAFRANVDFIIDKQF